MAGRSTVKTTKEQSNATTTKKRSTNDLPIQQWVYGRSFNSTNNKETIEDYNNKETNNKQFTNPTMGVLPVVQEYKQQRNNRMLQQQRNEQPKTYQSNNGCTAVCLTEQMNTRKNGGGSRDVCQ
jgi:hypothetical protein